VLVVAGPAAPVPPGRGGTRTSDVRAGDAGGGHACCAGHDPAPRP